MTTGFRGNYGIQGAGFRVQELQLTGIRDQVLLATGGHGAGFRNWRYQGISEDLRGPVSRIQVLPTNGSFSIHDPFPES